MIDSHSLCGSELPGTIRKKCRAHWISMGPGSLAFYLFEKENITFTSLLDILIKNAIISKNQESRYVKSFITSVLTKKGTKLIK